MCMQKSVGWACWSYRGHQCDSRVPTRWRPSALLLTLPHWWVTEELRRVRRFAHDWVCNIWCIYMQSNSTHKMATTGKRLTAFIVSRKANRPSVSLSELTTLLVCFLVCCKRHSYLCLFLCVYLVPFFIVDIYIYIYIPLASFVTKIDYNLLKSVWTSKLVVYGVLLLRQQIFWWDNI